MSKLIKDKSTIKLLNILILRITSKNSSKTTSALLYINRYTQYPHLWTTILKISDIHIYSHKKRKQSALLSIFVNHPLCHFQVIRFNCLHVGAVPIRELFLIIQLPAEYSFYRVCVIFGAGIDKQPGDKF